MLMIKRLTDQHVWVHVWHIRWRLNVHLTYRNVHGENNNIWIWIVYVSNISCTTSANKKQDTSLNRTPLLTGHLSKSNVCDESGRGLVCFLCNVCILNCYKLWVAENNVDQKVLINALHTNILMVKIIQSKMFNNYAHLYRLHTVIYQCLLKFGVNKIPHAYMIWLRPVSLLYSINVLFLNTLLFLTWVTHTSVLYMHGLVS